MAFSDYSTTPASNQTIGESTFIGPNMPRDNVRPALQQLAADGRDLYDTMIAAGNGNLPQFIQSGAGAVVRSVLSKMREQVSALDYFTDAQQADVTSYTGALDVTTALQTALNESWDSNRDLFIPAGLYKVTTLVWPGTADGRTKAFRVYGQGSGELFARGMTGGTIIQQTGGAASLVTNNQDVALAGTGNLEIAYIRFEGNSTGAVLDFETLYAQSELHHCGVFQSGSGDGIRIRHANTIELHHNYVLNTDWADVAPIGGRTGTGIFITLPNDNGLQSLRKNSCRGFETGYQFGETGTGGYFYSLVMDGCECSVVTNGIWLTDRARGSQVRGCYIEGGDGGFGLKDDGNYNHVSGCFFFPGFSIVLDSSTDAVGSVYAANTLALGAVEDAIGAKLAGGETFTGNHIVRTAGTAGQVGIQLTSGVLGARIDYGGNSFSPSSAWTGTGAKKIDNQVTGGGVTGFASGANADDEFPRMARGALSFYSQTLADSSVTGSTMTLPEGTHFYVDFTGATTVNSFDGGAEDGRMVILTDVDGNFDLNDSAQVSLAGGTAFSGPGTITLVLQRIASTTYAYEISRAVY